MRLALAPLLAWLAFAACSTFTVEEIGRLSDADLFRELGGFVARGNDGYRLQLVEEAARRYRWKEKDVAMIRQRRVWVGAREEHVIAAWGKPLNRDTHKFENSRTELWSYGSEYKPKVLTLENGICTAISSYDF